MQKVCVPEQLSFQNFPSSQPHWMCLSKGIMTTWLVELENTVILPVILQGWAWYWC